MKIKETYIADVDGEYVKLHYCINSVGSSMSYFIEWNNGVIQPITGSRFYEILDGMK